MFKVNRDVEINYINDLFMTAQFRYRELVEIMLQKRVNPLIFTSTSNRYYDKYRSNFVGFAIWVKSSVLYS